MNKKGFELAIGFFVILIMTLIIFGGSLYFLRQFYVTTEEFRTEIDKATEEQLQALMAFFHIDGSEGNAPVATRKAAAKRRTVLAQMADKAAPVFAKAVGVQPAPEFVKM